MFGVNTKFLEKKFKFEIFNFYLNFENDLIDALTKIRRKTLITLRIS